MSDIDLTEAIEVALTACLNELDCSDEAVLSVGITAAAPIIARQVAEKIAAEIEREAATLDYLPTARNDVVVAYREGLRHGMAGSPEHDLIGASGIVREVGSHG